MSVLVRFGNSQAQLDPRAPRVLLGRDPGCNMVHPDVSVSRRHAEVFLDNGQAFIRDLGSRNGTWVDGKALGPMPLALAPGQQVFVGSIPLDVQFQAGRGGATVVGEMPPQLAAMMEAHRQRSGNASGVITPKGDGASLGLGGRAAPAPAEFAYRRQGSNNNGVLLIALRSDTFTNNAVVDGYLEFTALDDETVASITVELVEVHRDGPSNGHVWDRVLVRQGPWHCDKNELVPMPFQLRVPPGVSMSGRDCHWEIRGLVDIDWAFDVDAVSPITMRNVDIERIRDALGALDYRITDIESEALGQRYTGKFQPPAQLQSRIGISDVNIEIEYLGTNMKVNLEVEKTAMFRFDKERSFTFDLAQLRAAPLPQVSQYIQDQIQQMMAS